ncbi:MAG: hypothetical protein K2X29_09930 [Candidatus Obscuribacterales bacterium]|nr:hypothetical protein [Candidatus Obscuribacterales bacterium]
MKRESKLLLQKALDSLILSIEHFNAPSDKGRVSAVLILLDHAFEMLLKAAIVHNNGQIRRPNEKNTIGFDACLRLALNDPNVKFLSEDQAIALQTINGCRDSAQHYLLEISEQQLYIHAQSGVTLFADILKTVFLEEISTYLPARVLPVSTIPPQDLTALFENESEDIAKMLKPGNRRRLEALARLRPLAILDASVRAEKLQPGESELKRLAAELVSGKSWREVFPGAASIEFTSEGIGTALNLRITKTEGAGFHLVKEGTPGASVIAIKRVGDLDFYSLDHTKLAEHSGVSSYELNCLNWYLKLKEKDDCCRDIPIGKGMHHYRYSQKAIDAIRDCLKKENIADIRAKYNNRSKTKKKS